VPDKRGYITDTMSSKLNQPPLEENRHRDGRQYQIRKLLISCGCFTNSSRNQETRPETKYSCNLQPVINGENLQCALGSDSETHTDSDTVICGISRKCVA
jgi:hypothetical protein